MTLSNGQIVELKQIDSKLLQKEERVSYNHYKNSTQSTLSARSSKKFEQALENEISEFNRWQMFVDEMSRRKGK